MKPKTASDPKLRFLHILIVILMVTVMVAVLVELITSTVTMLHTRNQCLDSKAWKPTWVRHQALHMRVLFNWS